MINKILFNLKREKFIVDVASLFGSRIIVLGISFLASILLARLLGPENKGLVTSILVIPTLIIAFTDLGIRQATTFFLGKGRYESQPVISTIAFLSLVTSFTSMIVALIVYDLLGIADQYGWGLIWISIMVLPVTLISNYGTGVLLAKQQIKELAISNLLSKLVYFILVASLFLLKSGQVFGAVIVQVISLGINTLYIVSIVRRFGKIKPRYVSGLPIKFLKKGFIYAIALFILGLNYRIDIVILGRLSSTYEVGIYSIGVGFAEMIWLLPASLTTVNFARSSAAKDSHEHALKTALVLRLTLLLSLVPVIGLIFISPWIIPVLYGAEYAASGVVIQAILPGVWLSLIFKILNSDLAGRGKPEAALWVYVLAVIINIILNVIWVPQYGALGSAWASSISYSFGALIFAIAYSRISQIKIVNLLLPTANDFHRLLGNQALK